MAEKKKHGNKRIRISSYDIALIGIMVAVIEVSKAALSFLPNVELTTFWLILFTLFFGQRVALVVPVFILIEGCMYGVGLWWIMYLYAWPLLVGVAWFFRKQRSVWFWAILSGAFGLMFGALCAIPYIFVGTAGGKSLTDGLWYAVQWWVAGIPFDIVHCIGNFTLMVALYHPMRKVLRYALKRDFIP